MNKCLSLVFTCFFLALFLGFSPSKAEDRAISRLRGQLYDAPEDDQRLKLLSDLALAFKAYATDSVLAYALEYQKLAEEKNDSIALSESYRLLSWARGLMKQNVAQLIQDGQKALEIARQTRDSLSIIQSGLSLSTGFIALQKMEEAQDFVRRGIEYGKRNGRLDILYESYNRASYLALLTDLEASEYMRRQSLRMARQMNDTLLMGIAMGQLASLMKLKKNDSTLYYFQKAKQLYQLYSAPLYEGIFLFNLAEYYGDLGYGDSLLVYGLKANELGDSTQNVQVQRGVKALLFAHYFNKQAYTKAEPFAQKALELEKRRPSVNYVSAFVDMARVEAALGRPDSAEAYFRQALIGTQMINYPRAEVLARVYYGEFLKKRERYDEALVQLRKAKELGDEKDEAAVRDFVLLQLAEVEFFNKNFTAARSLYKEAIALGSSANEADLLAQGYQALAQVDSALGNFEQAYKNQNLYLLWNDSLLRRTYNEKTAELEVKFETAQREAQIIQLEQEGRIQNLELAQIKTQRSFILGIAIILAVVGSVIAVLLFRLRGQNEKIQVQRKKLQDLNETKDKLFAMIAHDLRGPITGFQSTGKIFDRFLENENYDKLSQVSRQLEEQSNQLRQLLDNLLNWSLQQLGRYESMQESVSLRGLGQQILRRYSSHAEAKDNELKIDIPEGLNWQGDRNGLSVALNNLVGNANKFTQNGIISLSGCQEGHFIMLEVADTGRGMSKELQERLFSERGGGSSPGTAGEKGTGLGTQIVRQLVDHWQGRIEVESQERKGSKIRLILPAELQGDS